MNIGDYFSGNKTKKAMVHYSDYKPYRDIEGYFDRIKELVTKADHVQAAALFQKLSEKQASAFFMYITGNTDTVKGAELKTLRFCLKVLFNQA